MNFDFAALEQKYGAVVAYHCLQEIEKAARIRPGDMIEIDPDNRLSNALRLQDAAEAA